MRFTETAIAGAFIIEIEPHEDERGFFARTFCAQEFAAHDLIPSFVQCNLSINHRRGTLRGMHYQIAPACEAKFVRCVRGAIYDVVVDLRPGSPTYRSHAGVELSAENRCALYMPELCAAGYQSLADETEVLYQVSGFYAPAYERGLRYNDPALAITWPLPVTVISPKDASWPLISAAVVEAHV